MSWRDCKCYTENGDYREQHSFHQILHGSSSFVVMYDGRHLHSVFFRVDNLSKRGSVCEARNGIPKITNA
jgi:hypothetical protein